MNRDTLVAVVLLLACGVLLVASFDIREPDYGQLSPAAWPRAVVAVLALLSLIYLLQSLRRGRTDADADNTDAGNADTDPDRPVGIGGVIAYWRNVLWCFGLFLLYLLVLPELGMLVAGTLFVFLLLNALGGWTPRLLLLHALIALISVGGMWTLFTYGLGVLLPSGELFGRF